MASVTRQLLQTNVRISIVFLLAVINVAATAVAAMSNRTQIVIDSSRIEFEAENATRDDYSQHRERYAQEHTLGLGRDDRESTCSYEDEECVFVVRCFLSAGVRGERCAGSFLYTCCSRAGHEAGRPSSSGLSSTTRPDPSAVSDIDSKRPGSVTSPALDQRITKRGFKDDAVCGRLSSGGSGGSGGSGSGGSSIRSTTFQKRIIGGDDAQSGEFPWQAHIKIGRQQCGGALVSLNYVLTAAHCVHLKPLRLISIVLGAIEIHDTLQAMPSSSRTYRAVQKKLHPSFEFSRSQPDRFDVALLRLDRYIRYNSNISPVCLPPRARTFEGRRGTVTGWGKTDVSLRDRYGTQVLQKVQVPIISRQECETWHQLRGINIKIHSEMMCAGYKGGKRDACVGDSGGPMTLFLNDRWTIVGITSAGFGCAQSHQPGIYHLVSMSVDWILDNI